MKKSILTFVCVSNLLLCGFVHFLMAVEEERVVVSERRKGGLPKGDIKEKSRKRMNKKGKK